MFKTLNANPFLTTLTSLPKRYFSRKKSVLPQIIPTNNATIHLYTSDIEHQAKEQVFALANSSIPTGPVNYNK